MSDAITPSPVLYEFPSSFADGAKLSLLAYTVETILAEKCESILKRNVVGTRPRDYYDVYMLTKLKKVRPRIFKSALRSTFEKCGTLQLLGHVNEILDMIANSSIQERYWQRYQAEFPFARDIAFADALVAVKMLLT